MIRRALSWLAWRAFQLSLASGALMSRLLSPIILLALGSALPDDDPSRRACNCRRTDCESCFPPGPDPEWSAEDIAHCGSADQECRTWGCARLRAWKAAGSHGAAPEWCGDDLPTPTAVPAALVEWTQAQCPRCGMTYHHEPGHPPATVPVHACLT